MQKPDMYQLVGTHNMTETAADGTIANPGNGLNILEPIHRIKDIWVELLGQDLDEFLFHVCPSHSGRQSASAAREQCNMYSI